MEYLKDLNASAAARRAGYSAKTANRIGQENLTKPDISKEISRLKAERKERVMAEADDVLRELISLAFSNISNFIRWGIRDIKHPETGAVVGREPFVELVNMEEIPMEKRAAVKEVSVKPGMLGPTIMVRMQDKIKPLELLGKHLNLWDDRLKLSVDPDDPLARILSKVDGETRGLPAPHRGKDE